MELKFDNPQRVIICIDAFNRTICGIEIQKSICRKGQIRSFNRTICGIEICFKGANIPNSGILLIAPFVELKCSFGANFLMQSASLLIAPFVELK